MMDKKPVLTFSIIFTAMMAALIFFVYNFKIPNPNMILVAALVLSTSIGGVIPGGICAAMMWVYSLFFFSMDHSFVRFTGENLSKIAVITLGILVNYVAVSALRHYSEKTGAELRCTNEELLTTNEELKKVNELLHSLASIDPLTQLRNRTALRQDFDMFLGLPLVVIFMDLDNFKVANDKNGHPYGDQVLSVVGKTLKELFSTFCCYRYGGDEFLLIGEEDEEDKLLKLFDQANETVVSAGVSISGGYVQGVANTPEELRNMIGQADEMLYRSKQEGKKKLLGRYFTHRT